MKNEKAGPGESEPAHRNNQILDERVPHLTDDYLYTAAILLCSPGRARIEEYDQKTFDWLCEEIRLIQIAAHKAGHPWLADALDGALENVTGRFLGRRA